MGRGARPPVVREHVQFPDVRIEYEHPDGRKDHEDLELATGHYNSRQMAAKRASGFQIHRAAGRFGGAAARAAARRSTRTPQSRCFDDHDGDAPRPSPR